MKIIKRYQIPPVDFSLDLPISAEVVKLGIASVNVPNQGNVIMAFAFILEDDREPLVKRNFAMIETGKAIFGNLKYIDTIPLGEGIHLFEIEKEDDTKNATDRTD